MNDQLTAIYFLIAGIAWLPLARRILLGMASHGLMKESDKIFAAFFGLIVTILWPLTLCVLLVAKKLKLP